MPVTLINAFSVPEHETQKLLEGWKKTSSLLKEKPGFIETHLHRNTGQGDRTSSFVNIAKWESFEALQSSHPTGVSGGSSEVPGIRAYPGIFQPIIDLP